MDRDLRWEKERQAFDAMVSGAPETGAYEDAVGEDQGALFKRV